LKLLVFEYINGGGCAGHELSTSLQREGALMLQTLLNELKSLKQVQLTITLDRRCHAIELPEDCEVFWVDETTSLMDSLRSLLSACDAFWPIAPESDGILTELAHLAEDCQVPMLLSDAATVALCSDKRATYQALLAANLLVVETRLLVDCLHGPPFETLVVKPIDGVSCVDSRIIENSMDYLAWIHSLRNPEAYVVQPFVAGEAKSWSALFKAGRAWLLSCNRQQVVINDHGFSLQACEVNVDRPWPEHYQAIIDKVALALPGLWGYVGIDFIDTQSQGPMILEINPRLTTSYVGLGRSMVLNVAEQVLGLRDAEPCIPQSVSPSYLVSIS
jgi:predicted ATP-grasp superfamily ATP-dependent carboligase